MQSSALRTRWAAIGAAVAVTLGAGGVGLVAATSPAGAVAYVPIEPCRAADTRPAPDNVGPRITPLGAAETHVVNSNHGNCAGDVPGTATGLQLNVTALGATQGSFLTIWATGARPLASSLNPTPGEPPVPNAVTTGITGAGNFNVYNNVGNVHVVIDIVGYYTDHNHDDRYYTEAEVNGALAAIPRPVAFGYVNANGTLQGGQGVVSSSWNAGLSRYEVDLDVSYFFTSYATAVTTTCNAHVARTDSVSGNLLVIVTDGGNTQAQCGFGFIVYDV